MRSTGSVLSRVAATFSLAALVLAAAACTGTGTTTSTVTSKSDEPGAYTKAFVEQAVDRYESDGRDAAIAYHNTAESVDGDWYVFVIDANGAVIAHPTRPERIGVTFDRMVDVTGYNYGADFATATDEGKWVQYTYLNPVNGNFEKKHTWVVKHDGLIFGSGWYNRTTASLLPSKTEEPDKFTQAFVEQAIRRYEAAGRDAAFAFYNSMASVDGDWYVFVVDESGTIVVHGTVPEAIGANLSGVSGVDITGYRYGDDILAATEEGAWVRYVFLNPADDEEYQRKHAWFVRHDGLIFGSGWYERDVDFETDPEAFTKAYVNRAILKYNDLGREDALAFYNSTDSVEGEWYLFVIDESGDTIIHPTIPENIGQNVNDELGTDSRGYNFGPVMLETTEEGSWVSYYFLNPADGAEGQKHAWVVRHDGLVFGSGWYERDVDFETDPEAFTKAYVNRAILKYNDLGRDAAFAHYNSTDSVDGEWYLFVIEESGETIVHGTVPEAIGANLSGISGVDITGYHYGDDILAATEEGTWVRYVFLNPADDEEYQRKHAWLVRHDGLVFGSGWYERDVDFETDPEAFTKAYVNRAILKYNDLGRDAAFAHYNSTDSVDGEWYLFVIEESGETIVHPTIPENIGQNVNDELGTDSRGYNFGPVMLETTEEGSWVSYYFLNPADGAEEQKHAWVVRHDGLIFGSGWYEE